MDEASIANALQADLQDYKIKPQIRRKESQLHVLITRSESDEVDYALLYSIVKKRIDSLSIEGADCLVMYGRLAGAKQPEWQRTGEIKPPLPLIEFDIDDLEEFDDVGNIGNMTFSLTEDVTGIQFVDSASIAPEELDSFEKSIENALQAKGNEISNGKVNDFEIGDLSLKEFNSHNNGRSNNFELDSLELEPLELGSLDLEPFEDDLLNNKQDLSQRSPENHSSPEEELALDETTVVAAMPLPLPPPLPPKRKSSGKQSANSSKPPSGKKGGEETEWQPTPTPKNNTRRNALLLSISFATVAIGIVGLCGWLLWNRSVQQEYLANARNLENQSLNPKKITKLDVLAETRNQLQTSVSQLEEISDRPASLYAEAQAELINLRPKLEEFDRKVNAEQQTNKAFESSKNFTIEAAKLVQNPPHKSTVWKSAQAKRQQALKLLETVPTDSLLYVDAQNRLKAYRADLLQISKRVELQQRAESLVGNVNSSTANQLKQLKVKAPEKQDFLPQCKAILQPQISNADVQKVGIPVGNLTEYLCAYFWDS